MLDPFHDIDTDVSFDWQGPVPCPPLADLSSIVAGVILWLFTVYMIGVM